MATKTDRVTNDAMKGYVLAITGKTSEELSALNPDDEIELAEARNGRAPTWPDQLKGSFRGHGNINIANRRLKTLDKVDGFLDALVKNGARQY